MRIASRDFMVVATSAVTLNEWLAFTLIFHSPFGLYQ